MPSCPALALALLVGIGTCNGVCAAADPAPQSNAAALNERSAALQRTDPDAALQLAEQALLAARTDGDRHAEAIAQVRHGQIKLLRGDFAAALERFGAALDIGESAGDNEAIAAASNGLGTVLDIAGIPAEALAHFQRAHAVYRELGNGDKQAALLNNLGNVLDNLGDREQARRHYERALALREELGLQEGSGSVLANLGEIDLKEGRIDAAIARLEAACATHQRAGNHASHSIARGSLAQAYLEKGDASRAVREFEHALDLAQQSGNLRGTTSAEIGLSAAHLRRAERARGSADVGTELDAAAVSADRAVRLLAGTDDPHRMASALQQLAAVRVAQQDFELALDLRHAATALAAVAETRRETTRSAVLAARYRNEQQAAEIRLLSERGVAREAELGRQRWARNSALGGAVALALFAALLIVRARERQRYADDSESKNRELRAALDDAHRQRLAAEEHERVNAEILKLAAEDLRTPLLEMRSAAERLLTAAPGAADRNHQVAGIARVASDLVQVVGHVIEAAELESSRGALPDTRVDLALLLKEQLQDMEPRARVKRQTLTLSAAESALVRGDGHQLGRIIGELLENAIKFSAAERSIEIALRRNGTTACLQVTDHGPGLSKEEIPHLFGRFRRLSARPTAGERWTGLGLAMIKTLAERHGGRIYAESAGLGYGCVFVVELPIAAD